MEDNNALREMLSKENQVETKTTETKQEVNFEDLFKAEIGMDFLQTYKEIDESNDNIDTKIKAYENMYNNMPPEEKQEIQKVLKNSEIKKVDKLKDILKKGEEYYNNSEYGLIQEAGGEKELMRKTTKLANNLLEEKQSWEKEKKDLLNKIEEYKNGSVDDQEKEDLKAKLKNYEDSILGLDNIVKNEEKDFYDTKNLSVQTSNFLNSKIKKTHN